jgi:peptidoglycan hydrolase CwlO-like protein
VEAIVIEHTSPNRMSGLLDRKYMLETQLESIEEEIECIQSQIDEVEYYGR